MAQPDYIRWLRSRVGTRRVILVFSTVVLRDDQGRILLQRRSDFTWWGLPGGALEPGEAILDCARREVLEETGLQTGELRLVGVYTDPAYESTYPNGDQVQQFTICFTGRAAAGHPQPDGEETRALAFFAPQELPRADMPPYYVAMVDDVLRQEAAGGEAQNAWLSFEPPFSRPETISQIEVVRPLIGTALYIGAGAVGVVTDSQGQILVVRTRDQSTEWTLPGGFTNLGENAAQTIVREIAEETGLQVQPERLMGVDSPVVPWVYPNGDAVQSLGAVFRCRLLGGAPRPDQSEIAEIGWISPAVLAAQDGYPYLQKLNRAVVECLDQGVFVV